MYKKNIPIFLIGILFFGGCSLSWKAGTTPPTQNNQKPKETTHEDTVGVKTPTLSVEEELQKQGQLKKFDSLDDLEAFLKKNESSSGAFGMGSSGDMKMEAMAVSAPMPAMSDTASRPQALPGPTDYSDTNVQVQGVDEADIIKTDGKFIYAVVKNDLFIVEAYPAENAKILSKIAFRSRPQDMYISGDRLVVFGSDTEFYATPRGESFAPWGQSQYTFFKVFDITDRENPQQVKDLDFEGNYNNSRMIGEYVYFVTDKYNYQYGGDPRPLLPEMIVNGEPAVVGCTDKASCIHPEVYYFDVPYDNFNFVTVSAIDIMNPDRAVSSNVFLLPWQQNMYVSQNNMYLTHTKYIDESEIRFEVSKLLFFPLLDAEQKVKVQKIESAENYILSDWEKRNKIQQIFYVYASTQSQEKQKELEGQFDGMMRQKYTQLLSELEKTVVHKISLQMGQIHYEKSAEVPGNVLNQFSMDESGGFFRIATTRGNLWSEYLDEEQKKSFSNVYVLDSDMNIAGSLINIAPEERIYSVRFMQNRAYMVTFQQVDPLFVIDLSDPKSPQILGKLKVPGFSNYLHPYDDNTLIGVGKDTEENSSGGVVTKGIKISLFDVSDVGNPKEKATTILGDGGSDSIALYDHKAFLFSREKNLLSIPVTLRESQDGQSWGKLSFSGAAVFEITPDTIELKGKIDHSDGGAPATSDFFWGYNYYDNNVLRTLYIGDVLYTFSNKYLKANSLSDLSEIAKIELKKDKDQPDFEVIH